MDLEPEKTGGCPLKMGAKYTIVGIGANIGTHRPDSKSLIQPELGGNPVETLPVSGYISSMSDSNPTSATFTHKIAVIWGILGVSSILISAIFRLFPRALAGLDYPWTWYHWVVCVIFFVFMIYSEVWRGFHQRFSPTVASRLKYLSQNGRWIDKLLAPLFGMGYFHATRHRKLTSFGVTFGVILLIVMVHYVSQPWRGIIDIGVIGGLALGVIDVWYFIYVAFTNPDFDYPAEVD